MANRIAVIAHSNSEYISCATNFELSKQYLSTSMMGVEDKSSYSPEAIELYEALNNLWGVTEASMSKYECSVKFGDAFEPMQIVPKIVDLLQKFYLDHRLNREEQYHSTDFELTLKDRRHRFFHDEMGGRTPIDLAALPDYGVVFDKTEEDAS